MIETSVPSRADVMSVIGKLEGLQPVAAAPEPSTDSASTPFRTPTDMPPAAAVSAVFAPASAPPAGAEPSVAASSQPDRREALREMTVERDAWRSAAEELRADLRRQLEAVHADSERQQTQTDGLALELEQLRQYAESLRTSLEAHGGQVQQQQAIAEQQRAEVAAARTELAALRTELRTRDEQITHLTAAMTSLIEIAQGRIAGDPAPAAAPPAPRTSLSRGNWDLSEPESAPSAAPDMVIPKLAPDTGTPFKTVRLGASTPKVRKNPADMVPVIEAAAS